MEPLSVGEGQVYAKKSELETYGTSQIGCWLERIEPARGSEGVYVDRIAGCYRHYRHPGSDASARAGNSQGKGRANRLCEQLQTDRFGHGDVHSGQPGFYAVDAMAQQLRPQLDLHA